MSSPPVALSIAGSDNSAGAGAQADLKTMSALGVYGVTAITCIVAEVPGKVSAIHPVPPNIVSEQIGLLFEAFPIAALKSGMLYSAAIAESVCVTLQALFAGAPKRPFFVVDPVMVATSGHALLKEDGLAVYEEGLFRIADLITPNLDEVRILVRRSVDSLPAMRAAGEELVAKYHTAFLLKGGHLREAIATDLLITANGEVSEFSAPFVPGISTHGTGCAYSAAITAGMARGLTLHDAVAEAKRFVSRAIAHFFRWERVGGPTDALNHFAAR